MLTDIQEPVNVEQASFDYYYTPKEVKKSGEKEEDKLNDKVNLSSAALNSNPAVLILEDDIINSSGYGLKKGFYNVAPDKYLDFLYIYQSGKIKAKVPVIKMETFESINTKQEKPKKMSYAKFIREQEKLRKKAQKGENPQNIDYKEAQIHYIEDKKAYVIIYNSNNIELTGIIKF